jgi:hypothetical protein
LTGSNQSNERSQSRSAEVRKNRSNPGSIGFVGIKGESWNSEKDLVLLFFVDPDTEKRGSAEAGRQGLSFSSG